MNDNIPSQLGPYNTPCRLCHHFVLLDYRNEELPRCISADTKFCAPQNFRYFVPSEAVVDTLRAALDHGSDEEFHL